MCQEALEAFINQKRVVHSRGISNKFYISQKDGDKCLNKFSMGYDVLYVENKEYLFNNLKAESNSFSKIEILKSLKTKNFGNECYFFNNITSTNDYAKKLADNGYKEGTIVVSNAQTNGRGSRGRTWESSKNEGIFLSLILKPNIEFINISQINLIATIAMCRTIKKETGLNAKIKWPNDIIINGKKVCGLLTEVNYKFKFIKYIILGIGVNVNNIAFSQELFKKATSIRLELGRSIERKQFLASYLYELELLYLEYNNSLNFSIFLEEYRNLCLNIGKECKFIHKNKEITGHVINVNNFGEIIFRKKNGEDIKIVTGEVSLRSINGDYI